MLLERLSIKCYRGLEKLALTDLAPVSVIVGANNSGKSSVLEAVSLLLRPLDPAQWVQVARQRDMDVALVDALWSLFRSEGILELDQPKQSMPTEIEGSISGQIRSLDARAVATEDWDAEESGAATLRVAVKVDSYPRHDLIFRRDLPAQYGEAVPSFRCFTVTPIAHRSSRVLVDHLSRLVDAGDNSLSLELLQLFDSGVKSLDVSGGHRRQTIVVDHQERGVVDLASFGDGMRRAAALGLALGRAHQGVLLIDELEAGIHPTVLADVMHSLLAAAAAADVQIIATTHSLEALDALAEAAASGQYNRSVAAYYLNHSDGQRLVKRYDQERLLSLRSDGVDLR